MKVTLDELRDKNNPINESFNLMEKEVRKITNDESEVEKLLTERVVTMFVTSFKTNNEGSNEEEEFAKEKFEVGIKRCMVVEENEDEEKNMKLQRKKIKQETKSKNNHAKSRFESAPTMPNNFRECIKALGGNHEKLVIQKKIYPTDLSPGHNRFSIPLCQIRDHEFLSGEEKRKLHGNKGKLDVLLIEPCMEESMQQLKKWNMNSESYVLTHKWNDVVSRNREQLKQDNMVQLWSFRVESKLCFALIKTGDHGASTSRNRDLGATSSGSSSGTTDELQGL